MAERVHYWSTDTLSDAIGPFRGDYAFLSNFFPAPVVLDSVVYPTVEHAYQAAKTHDHVLRCRLRDAESPGVAKRMSAEIPARDDWKESRDEVMLGLLRQKFRVPPLRELLLATAPRRLVEMNTWNDHYWGVCDQVGLNRLGDLLERVREEQLP
jgi:ribA/ribD-fused uncharacterized protein